MPFIINQPELEIDLTDQCRHSPVPTSKGPLARAILHAVLDSAKSQKEDVFEVLRCLAKQKKGRKKRSA